MELLQTNVIDPTMYTQEDPTKKDSKRTVFLKFFAMKAKCIIIYMLLLITILQLFSGLLQSLLTKENDVFTSFLRQLINITQEKLPFNNETNI